ncbi:hypothetical protein JCM10213_007282 [Rhodosporidiobolus nylandii]
MPAQAIGAAPSCVTNRLLRALALALPYAGRLGTTTDRTAKVLVVVGVEVDSRQYLRTLRHDVDGDAPARRSAFEQLPEPYPNVERIVLSFPRELECGRQESFRCPGIAGQTKPASSVKSVEIRHAPNGPILRLLHILVAFSATFPSITSLTLFHCWRISRWRFLHPSMFDERGLATWETGDLWSRLASFSLAISPANKDANITPLKRYLEHFQLPPVAPLRSLSLFTQLPTHFTVPPMLMHDVVSAIIPSFRAPLSSLSIDEYASCTPTDLHNLATAFPSLRVLHLGDRMMWKGTRREAERDGVV